MGQVNAASNTDKAQPITWEAAEAAMHMSEQRFENGDVDGLVSKYHEDVVIRFATLPEIRGRAAAKAWLEKRLRRQLSYKLKKVLLSIDGYKVTRAWTGTWIDAQTKKSMEGRGIEFMQYTPGGELAFWDACFHVWEKDHRAESEYFDGV